MKSPRIAICLSLFMALFASAAAFASSHAAGVSGVEHSAARADYLLLAQSGAGNACVSACQGKYKSCLAPIDPACNSRGCTNEKNACNMQYEECTKNCR